MVQDSRLSPSRTLCVCASLGSAVLSRMQAANLDTYLSVRDTFLCRVPASLVGAGGRVCVFSSAPPPGTQLYTGFIQDPSAQHRLWVTGPRFSVSCILHGYHGPARKNEACWRVNDTAKCHLHAHVTETLWPVWSTDGEASLGAGLEVSWPGTISCSLSAS